MDGFINVLKPPGMTSSDAVLFVRRLLPRKTAVGHGGTLDPDAAGVLPVCVGRRRACSITSSIKRRSTSASCALA